jgi:hypothetical protein
MLERAIRPSFCLSCFCLVFDGSHLHPRLRAGFGVPPADTRRAGYPMRPRGRIECVHALSSFQRTKAPAARTVRRPFRSGYFPAAAPIRDRLSSLCRACLPCQPLFLLSSSGPYRTVPTSSGGFQTAYLAAGALDRGHRVKRVSPIYETDVSLSTPRAEKTCSASAALPAGPAPGHSPSMRTMRRSRCPFWKMTILPPIASARVNRRRSSVTRSPFR